MHGSPPIRNKILKILSASDLELLQPHLSRGEFKQRHFMERPSKAIETVVFPETLVASIVAQQGDLLVEIGLIGCEGMTGTSLVLNSERAAHATFVQIAGEGLQMPASDFRAALSKRSTIGQMFLKYVQTLVLQTAHTAVANSVGKLHERLARWLPVAYDRVESDQLRLTHEFLSIMLAVRRAGVTVAVNVLEDKGLIQCSRGVVTVLNRKGLEQVAGKFYGFPEVEYRRLLAQ